MPPWARASSLERSLSCAGSTQLPQWEDSRGIVKRDRGLYPLVMPDALVVRSKAAAERGRQRHAEKESGAFFPEGYSGLVAHGWHELSFSYCCLTGKVRVYQHPNEHARSMWKAMQCEHAVTGTADWCAILKDGMPWVDDLKTGWMTPEVLTAQLLFYSMCLSDLVREGHPLVSMGVPGAVAVSITHQPSGKGQPTREGLWRRASLLMIEDFRQRLTDGWRMTKLMDLTTAGPHCQWCPSMAWCDSARG